MKASAIREYLLNPDSRTDVAVLQAAATRIAELESALEWCCNTLEVATEMVEEYNGDDEEDDESESAEVRNQIAEYRELIK